jgi:fibro-slime domain-containing protein
VAPTEQCDDSNIAVGDGCSERCRVELGKKCEGQPSVCTDAVCGNLVKEGAEACDDGNTLPFDGCSPICLKEPNCAGLSCTSDCGDGLLIDEGCDDGNLIDGDGCSSTCTEETGFTCVAELACEQVAGQCVLRVPTVFRDFGESHPHFGGHACSALAPGAVGPQLSAEGRPVRGPAALQACIGPDGPEGSFDDWYTDNPRNVTLVGEIVLFENGAGGYVNRWGAQGEQFTSVNPTTERAGFGGSLAACGAACLTEANNQIQCANVCRPDNDEVDSLTRERTQRDNELLQAQNAQDAARVAQIEALIAQNEIDLAAAVVAATTCEAACTLRRDTQVATCSSTCKPCSTNPAQFCVGGQLRSYDGNPVFFPVDSIPPGPTVNSVAATLPEQYGYPSYPDEREIYPNAPNHNFFFTSEVQYWFKYDANTNATLTFLGDDDVWVFLNGRLAVDLGGIHVPSTGSVAINAAAGSVTSSFGDGRPAMAGGLPPPPTVIQASPADFGLVDGNVYKINIYHAERQVDGSSFQLTLAGFEATPSDCSAICGDGILSFGEECDDGVNDGGYNECGDTCRLGPFCGDEITQPEFGEVCDVGPGGDVECRGCRSVRIQ